MKRLNHRGFTLIELLATIVIVALVLGIGIYGVSNLVDNSKNKSKVISMSSIKESASVYSDEDSDRWIESYGDDYSYFCTTIEELINKGIIKKNAILPDGIDKSEYVSIKKNKTTLVKSEAVVLDSDGASRDESAYKVCTGNDIPTEGVSSPSIGGNTSYTDSIIVNFTDGDDAGIKDKWCQYNTNATIKDGVNVIKLNNDDSKCKIDNLKDDTNYYVRICKTTTGGSRACSDTVGYSTKEFIKPSISYSGLTSKIEFSDSGIESGKALHYFKSNIGGTSNAYVYECDNEFNCSSATKNISADKWYKTSNSTITIDYSNSDGVENGTISARISDGSNYSDVSSNFTLYKVVFKVGSADSIGGSSSDITKRCLTTSGSCSITSPSISKYCYSGMGWSTSSNANSSSWAPNSSKSISSSGTYYPTLGSIITYAINYNANGGYNAPSVQYKTCGKTLTLTYSEPSRSSYTFMGWGLSSYGSAIYDPGDSFTTNSATTLYAIWKDNTYSLNIYKDSGVSRIYYKVGSSSSYSYSSSNVYLSDIDSGTYVYYYGVAASDYEMDACTSSSPCSVRVTSNSSKTLTASSSSSSSGGSSYVYGIYYKANGDNVTGLPSVQYKDPGVALTLSSTKPTRSGYTFKGWSTSSSGGVEYAPGDKYYTDATVYMYAVWSSNSSSSSSTTYTVSYNANGGSGAPSSQTKYSGVDLTLSSTKPTRSGYTFKGWGTSSSSTSVSYYSGDTYSSNSSITLYAVWESSSSSSTKTYTITYHANGSNVTGLPSSQTKEHDKSIKLSSTKPTRPTYEFYGWSESSSATSATWGAGGFISASRNEDIDLYAVWHDPVSVSYDTINGYRCANGNKYYITTCTSSTCNYTNLNGNSSSGTVTKNTLNECSVSISVSGVSATMCSGTTIYLTCSATGGVGIKEAKIVDNGYTTYGSATLNTLRSGGISTVFTCTTNRGDTKTETKKYTVVSCPPSSSGSSCKNYVTCLGAATGYEACLSLAKAAGGTYSRNNPYGDCYATFCNSCPSGWTKQ